MKKIITGYRMLGIVACLVALYYNCGFSNGAFDARMLRYYTILSNILVLIYFVLALTPLKRWEWLRGGASVAILLTMLVYNLILAPQMFQMGSDAGYKPYSFADVMVHIVVPCFMLFDGIFFARKRGYGKLAPITWAVFPIAYLIYAMVRGATTGFFPYFFMDYNQIGIKSVVIYCAVLTAGYIGFGYLLLMINRFIGFGRSQNSRRIADKKTRAH